MQLGLIDYGAGNLHSVENTFKMIGCQPRLVRSAEDLEGLTHLVLPGVGSFGDCSRKLHAQGLVDAIRQWIAEDRPFFGICVGLQILMEGSEESPGEPGLGIFKGQVVRFPESELKVPHMGWNPLIIDDKRDPLWNEIPDRPHFYFVHSYFAQPEDSSVIASTCDYGVTFCAAICRGKLFATQFHPEKSQSLGARILQNFIELPA